ncbi:MAG: uracil-DNA glycosylase [Burkholderiales bacterium]|nr:uracil-DNA glycosylase [Burkholderiales bacterium]
MKNIRFKDSFDFIYGNLWLADAKKLKLIAPSLNLTEDLPSETKPLNQAVSLPLTKLVQPSPIIPSKRPAVAINDWHTLENLLNNCNLCQLSQGRNNVVIERGTRTAEWMFIGDETNAEEDLEIKPFVGKLGELLDKMIAAMQNKCNKPVSFYITNAVKCKTPTNRHPQNEEIESCQNYLHQQIKLVQPKIIIALGRFAAQALLNTQLSINKLRQANLVYTTIPVIVTYNPHYLHRNPQVKHEAWEDLQKALAIYQQITNK